MKRWLCNRFGHLSVFVSLSWDEDEYLIDCLFCGASKREKVAR